MSLRPAIPTTVYAFLFMLFISETCQDGSEKHWYTYLIEFADGKFYIGYRGSTKLPDQDFLIRYFSSSKEVKLRIKSGQHHSGKILCIFNNKVDAYNYEQDLIFKEISNPNILNKVCYKGRKGFGILTEHGREEISKKSKERWDDPNFKSMMVEKHKDRWTDKMKADQSERLKGKKRPEHSKAMMGRPGHTKCKGVKKYDGFGNKVSKSTKGVPKSEKHKLALSGPKPRVCRLTDRKEMSVNYFTRWLKSVYFL